jgi:hypothetical protein
MALAPFDAQGADPQPDWHTLIFPSHAPKSGHVRPIPATEASGIIRNAYATTFEKYWKETSYFAYDDTTGLKEHGFYVDSKTYGYAYLPWPIESRYDRPAPFRRGLFPPEEDDDDDDDDGEEPPPIPQAELFHVSPPHPEATEGPFWPDLRLDPDAGPLPFGGDNHIDDGFWTPGEAFNDVNGNGVWDEGTDDVLAEDYWYVDNYAPIRENSCGEQLPRLEAWGTPVGQWSARRGEFYADYNGLTIVDEDDPDLRVEVVAFSQKRDDLCSG